jgi:Asp-tRNA(Asn)/Glu-tRNA(Gln) amidotransferase A subunit family amidase
MDFTFALIRYTALFDHTGHPVVAMPMGLVDAGVASSVQVVAARNADSAAVSFARDLEIALGLKPDRTVLA